MIYNKCSKKNITDGESQKIKKIIKIILTASKFIEKK
jgi:hypothetical protein